MASSTGDVGYVSYDADVSTDGDTDHVKYLEAIERETVAAIEKIEVQRAGLDKTLNAKKTELKSVRAALKKES